MEKLRPFIAEFIGTFALIFIGIGAIHHLGGVPGGLLGIALAHGLTIAVMVSATGHISGGQLNPAVSLGVFVAGKQSAATMLQYWAAQLAGAVAAALLCQMLAGPIGADVVKAGTPQLGEWALKFGAASQVVPVTFGAGVCIEAVLTFFLVFVVLGTGVDGRAHRIGGLAIGLTVALDILFGGPLTGAAMNPARTFGPALVTGLWKNHAVYWIGPLLGGALAGIIYGRMLMPAAEPKA